MMVVNESSNGLDVSVDGETRFTTISQDSGNNWKQISENIFGLTVNNKGTISNHIIERHDTNKEAVVFLHDDGFIDCAVNCEEIS